MKQYNTKAAAMSLAVTRATGAVKQKIRDDGRHLREFCASELRTATILHLSEHPELFERAAKDVERWRTKITTKEKIRSR